MDDLISRIVECINELNEIAEELFMEHDMEANEIEEALDLIEIYERKLKRIVDKEESEPDLYHIKLQERLDAEARGEWV